MCASARNEPLVGAATSEVEKQLDLGWLDTTIPRLARARGLGSGTREGVDGLRAGLAKKNKIVWECHYLLLASIIDTDRLVVTVRRTGCSVQ